MFKRLFSIPLHWQIISALLLAALCGQLNRHTGCDAIWGVSFVEIYHFIGQLFLRALKMLIVPLIASAIITSIAGLGKDHAFGRLGLKTLSYYLLTSLLAILTGLFLVNIIRPGIVDGEPATGLLGLNVGTQDIAGKIEGRGAGDVVEVFLRMIPQNVVEAASNNGQMLSLIFFSILFGFFMTKIEGPLAETLGNLCKGVYEVMLLITGFVMKFAPLGVFGLVAEVAATTDLQEHFSALFRFLLTVVCGLGIHMFITMPILLKFLGRIDPLAHFRAMFPAILTAFSTSSSSATLPVTMECLQDNAGVSGRISNFTAPLGATINMDGTALYECVSVLFIVQLSGGELSLATQVITVVLALLTSVGVAGVPSASLVAIVVILSALNMPTEAIGVLMVFDRILDMCRTSVNIFGDACGAAIIARSEGEKTKVAALKTS